MDHGLQAHHKRKGSAVDMLDGHAPGSGKAARPSAGAEERQQQREEEEQEAQVLTAASQLHLTQLRTSQEELLEKIDEITAVGLATLERVRTNFQQRMAKVKQELGSLVDQAENVLRLQSANTLDCTERADMAGQLIGKLNIKTMDAQQQELFSAQEEPEPEAAE